MFGNPPALAYLSLHNSIIIHPLNTHNMLIMILIALGAIIAIVLLVALLIKKDYNISSSITINKPKDEVFNYVKIIRNQEKYSKWVMADPNVKIKYKGTDGTVGFTSAWESELKNVGVGEQEITNIKDGERYDVELRFEKPFKGVSRAHTTTEALANGQTRVTTVFESTTPFPMSIMIPMIKNMLKKDMDENASNLKKILEN